MMERSKKIKESGRQITLWAESSRWRVQTKPHEMNDVSWRASHKYSFLPFPFYTGALLGHRSDGGNNQAANVFEDCGAEAGSGQTERFYHADKGLLSAPVFVIIGRC